MFANLNLFQMAGALAMHAGQRQSVIAKNIANADVPGYKSKDIPKFSEIFKDYDSSEMRGSRLTHLNHSAIVRNAESFTEKSPVADPNGNTVSLETELMKSAETKLQHDMALQIYSSGMKILRASLGGR